MKQTLILAAISTLMSGILADSNLTNSAGACACIACGALIVAFTRFLRDNGQI